LGTKRRELTRNRFLSRSTLGAIRSPRVPSPTDRYTSRTPVAFRFFFSFLFFREHSLLSRCKHIAHSPSCFRVPSSSPAEAKSSFFSQTRIGLFGYSMAGVITAHHAQADPSLRPRLLTRPGQPPAHNTQLTGDRTTKPADLHSSLRH